MSTSLRQCERIARDEGLAAGLAMAIAGAEVATTAPGRWAAVPAESVRAGAEVRHDSLAAREGVTFLACQGRPPAAPASLAEIGRLLAAVRLGLVRRLLDHAVEHLSERVAGDEPLIRKQLITGTVADTMAEVELLREQAHAPHDPAALSDLHLRLDELGWQVLTLFGAAGYLADHPARALHVSFLVANTWIDREGVPE
ncbi:acyl-CoA dehydrogenase family protein [Streptomyces radicis]|uniref:Acyl-CoA dehydrogenase n=1 Tax=Streptomyces radicis TaxID=1750517 RepID=A0A3A9VW06_9ACTN|nr:acyl-CoA dehydrogenase family protein [Streptomyces radicis]RKN05108.1 acyl-CoA dehydrogenase [Streptomyces radicis]RKN16434.1 acyl-CoA dehydrogenase [Streptomyces radicis]